jgi:oligo-1,6-glucosidase/alpha-glucosidase
MLSLYRDLLRLRRAEPALSIGSFALAEGGENVLGYERRHDDARLLVALNLTGTERRYHPPKGALLLSTLGSPPPDGWLRPDEGVIVKLEHA